MFKYAYDKQNKGAKFKINFKKKRVVKKHIKNVFKKMKDENN